VGLGGSGSSGRMPAYQEQHSEFKPQYHQKKRKKKNKNKQICLVQKKNDKPE
jgi:hypothetical protein